MADIVEPYFVDEPVDFVYHLASPASPIDYLRLPLHTLKVGSYGTHHTLGLAKQHRARFLIASTSEVYGDPRRAPADRGLLGQRQPDRPARRLRRGQALRRGADDGLPPPAGRRHRDHPDLQLGARRRAGALRRRHRAAPRVRPGRGRANVRTRARMRLRPGRRRRRGCSRRPASSPASSTRSRASPSRRSPTAAGLSQRKPMAFIAHPTDERCFEVSTRYGRSVKVTGDHSVFVEGEDGRPEARPVVDLREGDRIAVMGRDRGARARPHERLDGRRLAPRRARPVGPAGRGARPRRGRMGAPRGPVRPARVRAPLRRPALAQRDLGADHPHASHESRAAAGARAHRRRRAAEARACGRGPQDAPSACRPASRSPTTCSGCSGSGSPRAPCTSATTTRSSRSAAITGMLDRGDRDHRARARPPRRAQPVVGRALRRASSSTAEAAPAAARAPRLRVRPQAHPRLDPRAAARAAQAGSSRATARATASTPAPRSRAGATSSRPCTRSSRTT